MAELAGRIALVTGASRGIGAATAVALARLGAHVVLAARTQGGLEQTDDAVRAVSALPRSCRWTCARRPCWTAWDPACSPGSAGSTF